MDVEVENFNGITSFQFSNSWNAGPFDPIVAFDRIEFPGVIPNFDDSNFDITGADVGIISLLWNDDSGNGLTLPDGTTIFSVCFEIIGDALNCTNFTFDDEPLPPLATSIFSSGNDIGVNGNNGQVCASDYLRIQESTLTNIGCPGGSSGSIFLRTDGGTAPYTFNWTGTNQTTEDVENLDIGTYIVRITDSSVPPNTVIDTFDLVVSGMAPIADAGADVGVPCNNQPIVLDGTGSSAGSAIRYRWFSPDTGDLVSPSNTTAQPTVTAEGTYILEVTNIQTNCVSFDTVLVTPANMQAADAGPDQEITCFVNEVFLDGSSPGSSNSFFFWRSLDGGIIDPATDSSSLAAVSYTHLTLPTIYSV